VEEFSDEGYGSKRAILPIIIIILDSINQMVFLIEIERISLRQEQSVKNILFRNTNFMLLRNNNYGVTELRGFSPQANYTDRATAACRRS
jgi:hypothetical protein